MRGKSTVLGALSAVCPAVCDRPRWPRPYCESAVFGREAASIAQRRAGLDALFALGAFDKVGFAAGEGRVVPCVFLVVVGAEDAVPVLLARSDAVVRHLFATARDALDGGQLELSELKLDGFDAGIDGDLIARTQLEAGLDELLEVLQRQVPLGQRQGLLDFGGRRGALAEKGDAPL